MTNYPTSLKLLLGLSEKNKIGNLYIMKCWGDFQNPEVLAPVLWSFQRKLAGLSTTQAQGALEHFDQMIFSPATEDGYTLKELENFFQFLTWKTVQLSRKWIFFFEAEKLGARATNKILKSLEEAQNTTILLFTSLPEKLLPTVRSRAVQLNLFPLRQNEIGNKGLAPQLLELWPKAMEGKLDLKELSNLIYERPSLEKELLLLAANSLLDKSGQAFFHRRLVAFGHLLSWWNEVTPYRHPLLERLNSLFNLLTCPPEEIPLSGRQI